MARCPSSNLSAVVDGLVLGISLEDIRVPPAAAENARRFAQHHLSLEAPAPRRCRNRPGRAQQPLLHALVALAGLLIERRAPCACGSDEPSASWPEMIIDGPAPETLRASQQARNSAPTSTPAGVGWPPSAHTDRSKTEYSLAVTTASPDRMRISAGGGFRAGMDAAFATTHLCSVPVRRHPLVGTTFRSAEPDRRAH
jgi:hypothetical protein